MTEKVWMITGASRGIGAEHARAVPAAGGQLVATARRLEGVDHLRCHHNMLGVTLTSQERAGLRRRWTPR